jgi:poly-beta-1,6-N-acetyl-D-glucosamine synthase
MQMQLISAGPVYLLVLLICFFVVAAIQLFYYWYYFARLAFFKPSKPSGQKYGVSVVIAAKNEYSNLKNKLPHILSQDYPEFEVVVVNDASNDDTIDLLNDLSRQYKHLKIVNIYQNLNFFSGKKFPLSIGIKSAKYDYILLTDADCLPSSDNWIRNMMETFSEQSEIVLGYGPCERKSGLLNLLLRFDTFHIAVQYLSLALAGKPYMGVGRNLAYRKGLFFAQKGFTSHYQVSSGDDDLFINQVANKKNTSIQIDKDAHMYSEVVESFGKWAGQKRRHLSTGSYYKLRFKWILGMYSLSQLLFYALFVYLAAVSFSIYLVLGVFAIRLFSQFFVLKKCSNRLNEKKLILISPFLELILIIFNLLTATLNLFVKQNKWK